MFFKKVLDFDFWGTLQIVNNGFGATLQRFPLFPIGIKNEKSTFTNFFTLIQKISLDFYPDYIDFTMNFDYQSLYQQGSSGLIDSFFYRRSSLGINNNFYYLSDFFTEKQDYTSLISGAASIKDVYYEIIYTDLSNPLDFPLIYNPYCYFYKSNYNPVLGYENLMYSQNINYFEIGDYPIVYSFPYIYIDLPEEGIIIDEDTILCPSFNIYAPTSFNIFRMYFSIYSLINS